MLLNLLSMFIIYPTGGLDKHSRRNMFPQDGTSCGPISPQQLEWSFGEMEEATILVDFSRPFVGSCTVVQVSESEMY